MYKFDVGMLARHPDGKITVKKHTFSDAAGGLVSDSESTVTTRRAWIRPLSDRAIDEARQVGEEVTHEIYLRYDSTSKAFYGSTHWFELGSRIFEIAGSPRDVDEEHRFLRFLCRERP